MVAGPRHRIGGPRCSCRHSFPPRAHSAMCYANAQPFKFPLGVRGLFQVAPVKGLFQNHKPIDRLVGRGDGTAFASHDPCSFTSKKKRPASVRQENEFSAVFCGKKKNERPAKRPAGRSTSIIVVVNSVDIPLRLEPVGNVPLESFSNGSASHRESGISVER